MHKVFNILILILIMFFYFNIYKYYSSNKNLKSKDFMQCLQSNPEIAINLLQVLASCLRDATDSQRQLALMDVYSRLTLTLQTLSREDNGINIVEPKPTQKDLARQD